MSSMKVCCKACGFERTLGDKLCSKCGSVIKVVEVFIEEGIGVHDRLDVKAKDISSKKVFQEQRIGDSLFKKTGEWNHLERIIDRKNDMYSKKIIDKRTGKIIKEVKEPLSKHIGHGSAKYKKKSTY